MSADVGHVALEDIVLRVSPAIRQNSLRLPDQAARAISNSPQWRGWADREIGHEPVWQDGLCGITLLPVEELTDLHFAPWVEDRPCLVSLTFLSLFWLEHCTCEGNYNKTGLMSTKMHKLEFSAW